MPIESITYISDFNSSNPVGSTDKVQTLDDHIRGMKSGILATFPGITGAVTPTHTELNFVDGVTSAIQTQLDTKAAAAALNASNLTSGTVPDARFPATLPAASGVNLTALNGTNIASGTVADARLSSNVPLKNASNTFTGALQSIVGTGVGQSYLLISADSSTAIFGVSDAASQIITGDSAGMACVRGSSAVGFSGNGGTNLHASINSSGNFDFKAGTVTTSNASASEVGLRGAPQNAQSSNYTLALTDAGHTVKATVGCSQITVPDDSAVTLPSGTIVRIQNRTGSTLTITKTTSSGLILNGTDSTTGARTLPNNSVCEVYKSQADEWIISGPVS